MADAVDEWILTDGGLMGGYVCSVCAEPVESEPCREHQPDAYERAEHCSGAATCTARTHYHGCFADLDANCDEPAEHPETHGSESGQ